ncbi:hypothetical protein ACFP3I_09785 [Chryseobacterium arachidis]|uniref:hypothetical protein n=1 Tax=Chryseobacterium arachidis TaxID=1416778 RepID=UPI003619B314
MKLFPAFHYIFWVTGSASLRPQPKRMPLQSGLGIGDRLKISSFNQHTNLIGFQNL